MKAQIKEVQQYFKNKLLKGEFEATQLDKFRLKALVDGEYEFVIWVGNMDIPRSTIIYHGDLSFMAVPFLEEEATELNTLLRTFCKARYEAIRDEKIAELKEIEQEIAELNK